jgi:hypothetical protein
MEKFGKVASAAIYGGDNYKYYYGFVDFTEKGCAKECMDQLMSSDEEMKFLNAGEKSYRTFLRYKWKPTEENPELLGIVTREYNNNNTNTNTTSSSTTNYSTTTTNINANLNTNSNTNSTTTTTSTSTSSISISSSIPNVLAPPFIPSSFSSNHNLSNRRSGNLNLENSKLTSIPNNNNINSNNDINDYSLTQQNTYYPISNHNSMNTSTPTMMTMGMNMNMGMNMGMGMNMNVNMNNENGSNNNSNNNNNNSTMVYPNSNNYNNNSNINNSNNDKYNSNWQSNNINISNRMTGRGRGRGGGLSHRSSNRSIHSTGNRSSFQNSMMNSSSTITTTIPTSSITTTYAPTNTITSTSTSTAASKGINVNAKEFVMPIKKKSNYHISLENFYYNQNQDVNSNSNSNNSNDNFTSYSNEERNKVNVIGSSNDKDTLTKESMNRTSTEEEDTIVEKQSQDSSSVKEDITENINDNDDIDVTETASNSNENESLTISTSTATSTSTSTYNLNTNTTITTNQETNPTAEDIISSLEQNSEMKWGDMKDSSTLPPLSNLSPFTSISSNSKTSTTTTTTSSSTPSLESEVVKTYDNHSQNYSHNHSYNPNPNYSHGHNYNQNFNKNSNNYNNNKNNNNNGNHGNGNGNSNSNSGNRSSKQRLSFPSSYSSEDEENQGSLPEFVSKPLTRTKLNISRIPPGMTYDQLYSLFLEHGQILDMTIKPAKIGTVAFLEYSTPAEAMEAVRELDDAYAVDASTPIHEIPQNLESLCVDYAYSDGITRHHREGVTPVFIKGLPGNMKRGDLKIICVEFGDLAKTRLSKMDNGHGIIKCSATIEYVRKDSTRLALAYLGDLFHRYGYSTVKVEKYNTNRNSYKPSHPISL